MKITKENLKKMIKEEFKLVNLLKEGKRQHGFDLTDFKNGGFQKVLKALGIRPKAQEGRSSGWEWKGNGILIVTGNDPITGEYYSQSSIKRKNEKNYASYIGVEGDSKKVDLAVELIRKYATYIKKEDPKRRSYI
jgi:hypothetical protein